MSIAWVSNFLHCVQHLADCQLNPVKLACLVHNSLSVVNKTYRFESFELVPYDFNESSDLVVDDLGIALVLNPLSSLLHLPRDECAHFFQIVCC